MKNDWLRIIFRYFAIGMIGSVVIVAGAPFAKTETLRKAAGRADSLFRWSDSLSALSFFLQDRLSWKAERSAGMSTPGIPRAVKSPEKSATRRSAKRTEKDSPNLRPRSVSTDAPATFDGSPTSPPDLAPKTPPQHRENPYAEEYAAAKAAYEEYWRLVRELTAKRDAASGAERIRYSNQLREMRAENTRLSNALQAAGKKFKNWREEQSESSGAPLYPTTQPQHEEEQ